MSSAGKSLIKHVETFQGVESLEEENDGFQKDTKYSWFVCSCAFITQIFVLGTLHAFGVFFVEFIKEFKSAKGQTAWIGSLAYGLSMTFGPISSSLVTRFGNNRVMATGGVICAASLVASSFAQSVMTLFVTFSLFYAIGTCMCTVPTMTIMPEYFDKYLAVATGITVAGSSFGTLIMGPLSQAIIDKAGWRTAFRVYAGFCIITSLLNYRIRTPPRLKKRKLEGHSFIKDLQIWKNRVFVVWTISITLVMFGFYIPYVHLVSYAVDQGVSQDLASLLIMILGATTATGRIMFGKIVQYGVLNRLHMHQLSMLVTGTGVMVLPLLKSFPLIVVYVIVVGLVDGCYVVLLPILTASLMGIENSVLAWGFMIGSCSVTFTLGPPAAGALYDMTGSYNVAFHCAGLPILAGAALLFLIPWAQRTARGTNILSMVTETTCITIQDSNPEPGVHRTDSTGTITGEESVMESIPLRDRSMISVRTTGTSPGTPASSYVDKATSTGDIVPSFKYSLDVADALSQLSYNSDVFEEMLRRSTDNTSGAMVTSATSQEIPRIPPPSQPMRYRRRDDKPEGECDSSVSSKHSQGSENIVREPTVMQHALHNSITPGSIHSNESLFKSPGHISKSVHSGNSGEDLPSASQLFNLLAHSQTTSVPLPVPMKPNSNPDAASVNCSVPEPEPKIESSDFDAAISAQVSLMLQTLTSPPSSPKEADVNDDESENRIEALVASRHSSVSPAIDIIRPTSPFTSQKSPLKASNVISEPVAGPSFLASQISQIEAATRSMDSSYQVAESGAASKTHFEQENQLTVIPAKKQSPPGGNKLEDLFRPICEEDAPNKAPSFEIVETGSGCDVIPTRSQTGEIDVFTHLFDDEETIEDEERK